MRDEGRLDANDGLESELIRERERADVLERTLREERTAVAAEARRIASSRAWRLGHGVMRLGRRLSLRKPRSREGGPEALAERLEGLIAVEGDGTEPTAHLHATLAPPRRVDIGEDQLARLAARRPVSVIVPIHNAPDELERCLAALVRNTSAAAELVLIDDASTEPRVRSLLEEYGDHDGVRVLRNAENRGFPATVNRGFEETRGDVVLLNSDTEVAPRWLENLLLAAHSDERVATVTPLSDNAGAFSAPATGIANTYPANLPKDDVGRLVTRRSQRLYPRVPVGNGFCMYVSREALDEIGGFDAEAFGRGYGEENDFCLRASAAGWQHLIDDSTLVFHHRRASFGGREAEDEARTRQVIDGRYPHYTKLVRDFRRSARVNAARSNVRDAFRYADRGGELPRILYSLHHGQGGTPMAALDLIRQVEPDYECFLLTSDRINLRLSVMRKGALEVIGHWRLDSPLAVTDFTREDYRAIVASILVTYSIDLLHVRHLIKHTFDLPRVAASLGIPVVISFHDSYLCCPTVHLIDDRLQWCEGVCTPGDGRCHLPNDYLAEVPPLKHRWVYEWREETNRVLDSVDACVTTSETTKAIHERCLPRARELPFEVIEHGRELTQWSSLASPPPKKGPVRILLLGNMSVRKGGRLIREIKSHDQDGRLELHLVGDVEPEFEDLGACHGPYEREQLPDLVGRVRPSFVGCFSIHGESYSHVISEAWACGVPVLASDHGAFRERVLRHGGGWLIDPRDPRRAYEQIMEISSNPEAYAEGAAKADLSGVRSAEEMSADYDLLYRRTLRERLAFASRAANGSVSWDDRRVIRLALLVPERRGRKPGSAHVRCLRRLSHPLVREKVRCFGPELDQFIEGRQTYDILLVQRDAVPGGRVPELLDAAHRSGTAVVLELDDDLLESDVAAGLPANAGPFDREAVVALAGASDGMIVSTESLAEVAKRYADTVRVVPNMLDERLWFGAGGVPPTELGPRATGRPSRFLFMGSGTHVADLDLIRSAFDRLRAGGTPAELEVIGGEPASNRNGWYTRLQVPGDSYEYPRFVPWLRSQAWRWDAAIAPLEATPFSRCKSDLKFLDYSALGLPGAYSDIGVYRSCEDDVSGLLVENTEDAWLDALRRLAGEPETRERIGSAAYAYVKERRCLRNDARTYLEALCSAL